MDEAKWLQPSIPRFLPMGEIEAWPSHEGRSIATWPTGPTLEDLLPSGDGCHLCVVPLLRDSRPSLKWTPGAHRRQRTRSRRRAPRPSTVRPMSEQVAHARNSNAGHDSGLPAALIVTTPSHLRGLRRPSEVSAICLSSLKHSVSEQRRRSALDPPNAAPAAKSLPRPFQRGRSASKACKRLSR